MVFEIILNELIWFDLRYTSIRVFNKNTFLFWDQFFKLSNIILIIFFFNFSQWNKALWISEFEWMLLVFINASNYWVANWILIINYLNIFIFIWSCHIAWRLLICTFDIFSKFLLKFSFVWAEIVDHMDLIIIYCLSLRLKSFSHSTS